MMKVIEKRMLDEVPCDKYVEGKGFVHATGFEILVEGLGWWPEFEDDLDELEYAV